jgi:DNA-binding transcriptional MerR regulator
VTVERLYQIGEVADQVGLSLRTVRHYEEVGLVIPVARSQGGFRLYDRSAISRLRLIKQLKPLDFSLDDMRDVLQLRDTLNDPGSGSRERLFSIERLRMYGALAQERCKVLAEQLAAASAVAATLQEEADRAESAALRPSNDDAR